MKWRNIAQRIWNVVDFLCLRITSCLASSMAPCVVVDMKTATLTRRLAMICSILQTANFPVELKLNYRTFRSMNDYGRRLFGCDGIFLGSGRRVRVCTVSDYEDERDWKRILVEYDLYAERNPLSSELYFPIMFHPNLLNEKGYEKARRVRCRTQRKIGVLFAGNFKRDAYSRPIKAAGKNFITRYDIISAICEDGLDGRLRMPTSHEEFKYDLECGAYVNSFVLVDSDRFSIDQDEWLETLAEARYFLAPPGYRQPFCHNIVEAMAVGTVPITQYGVLFQPKLRNGVECFAFENTEGLLVTLKSVLESPRELDQTMSAAAHEYHDEYLSLAAAASSISDFVAKPDQRRLRLFLAGGPVSEPFFRQQT